MNVSAKSVARGLLGACGINAGIRHWHRNSLRILMYHRFPTPNALEAQCEHLAKHYRPVSLSEAADALMGRKTAAGAVAVTVDDGYRDFLVNAWPVFKAYGIPVLVYVATDLPDHNSWLWTDQLVELLRRNGEPEEIKTRLKRAPDDERRAYLASLAGLQPTPPPGFEPLTWDDIRLLASEGVSFGAHTRSHPILSRLSDRARVCDEVAGSKARLQEELSTTIEHFCYPNGTPDDFNEDVIAVVRECGFRTAVTAIKGMNLPGADPFRLRRLHQEPGREPSAFAHQVAGFYRV